MTGYKSKRDMAQDKLVMTKDEQEIYERGFIDGMQHQMKSTVEKAVNAMMRPWVGLTDEEIQLCLNGLPTQSIAVYARRIEAKLKEKNK